MLIRKDAIHPPPIEAEEFLLNLVKKLIYYKLNKSRKYLGKSFSLVKGFPSPHFAPVFYIQNNRKSFFDSAPLSFIFAYFLSRK